MAARISQEPVEVVIAPTSSKARISQEPVEVILAPTSTKARLSQLVVEVVGPGQFAWVKAAARFVLITHAFGLAQARFRLNASSYKDIATRFVLKNVTWAKAAVRFTIVTHFFKSAQTRFLNAVRRDRSAGARFTVNDKPNTPTINAPVDGGLYTALTLSATTITSGGVTWHGRWDYSTSADGYTAWFPIGSGTSVPSGQASTLDWALGPLDAHLSYKVRVYAIDEFEQPISDVAVLAGTFRIDHVSTPVATAPADNAVLDAGAAQTFTWTYSDPDGDAQAFYALRRTNQRDGSQSWWDGDTSIWGPSEIWNPRTVANANMPAHGWLPGDAYSWSVATKDSAGAGSNYSTPRTVRFSDQVVPAITAPAVGGSLATQSTTLQWTVAQQTKYRARLLTGVGFATVLQDTGVVVSTARSALLAGMLSGITVRFELTTWNTDSLPATVTRDKSVSYTAPATPSAGLSQPPGPPHARVTISNPGGGDAVDHNDLFRSDDGAVTFFLLASGLAAAAIYDDYRVAIGHTYWYRVKTYGVSDTLADSGPI